MTPSTLRRLASCAFRICTPVALAGALVVAGCETAPEPAPPQSQLRASSDTPSAAIVKHGKKIAAGIVADEAFAEFVELSAAVASDLNAAQKKRSDEENDAIAVTTTMPWFSDVMGPEPLLGHLGGDPEDLQQIQIVVKELLDNQGLTKASGADVRYLFELAFDSDAGRETLENSLGDDLVLSLYDPCEQACHNLLVAETMVALALFAIAMAVAVVTFPFGLLVAALAIAALNQALTQIQAGRDVCLAACDGVDLQLDLCGDLVCAEDEYCWKGPLGIGKDECRAKKSQNRVCSSDDACLSGCCKFNAWANPVSQTCRPANACN